MIIFIEQNQSKDFDKIKLNEIHSVDIEILAVCGFLSNVCESASPRFSVYEFICSLHK